MWKEKYFTGSHLQQKGLTPHRFAAGITGNPTGKALALIALCFMFKAAATPHTDYAPTGADIQMPSS